MNKRYLLCEKVAAVVSAITVLHLVAATVEDKGYAVTLIAGG